MQQRIEWSFPSRSGVPGRLTFAKDLLEGSAFDFETEVCPNPTCTCWRVQLKLTLVLPPMAESVPPGLVKVELDLEGRKVEGQETPGLGGAGYTVAAALQSGLTDVQWAQAREFYFEEKSRQTETADPRVVIAQFPPEAFGPKGATVGYYEILPFARTIRVRHGGRAWIMDDQYCVKLHCPCHYAVVGFHLEGGPAEAPTPPVTLRYDYKTGETEVLDESAEDTAGLPGIQLLELLRAEQSELDAFFAGRHDALRCMAVRAAQHDKPQPVRHTQPKTGRNDPCPCGSGRKYKKCCGAVREGASGG